MKHQESINVPWMMSLFLGPSKSQTHSWISFDFDVGYSTPYKYSTVSTGTIKAHSGMESANPRQEINSFPYIIMNESRLERFLLQVAAKYFY
jgi:hypothetical protein